MRELHKYQKQFFFCLDSTSKPYSFRMQHKSFFFLLRKCDETKDDSSFFLFVGCERKRKTHHTQIEMCQSYAVSSMCHKFGFFFVWLPQNNLPKFAHFSDHSVWMQTRKNYDSRFLPRNCIINNKCSTALYV